MLDYYASFSLCYRNRTIASRDLKKYTCKEEMMDIWQGLVYNADVYTDEEDYIDKSDFYEENPRYFFDIDVPNLVSKFRVTIRNVSILESLNNFIREYKLNAGISVEDGVSYFNIFSDSSHRIFSIEGIHAYYVLDIAVTLDRVFYYYPIDNPEHLPFKIIKDTESKKNIFYEEDDNFSEFLDYIEDFKFLMGKENRKDYICFFPNAILYSNHNGIMSFVRDYLIKKVY